MSAATATGGGGGTSPFSSIEVIRQICEVKQDMVSSHERPGIFHNKGSELSVKILSISQILIKDPDSECQEKGYELKELGDQMKSPPDRDPERDRVVENLKRLFSTVANLKIPKHLSAFFKQLREVETEIKRGRYRDKNPEATFRKQKDRAWELIREIRKDPQGEDLLMLLMDKIKDYGPLQMALLQCCSKPTAEKLVFESLCKRGDSFDTSKQQKLEIIRCCSERGADFKEVLEGKPIILSFFNKFIQSFYADPEYIGLDVFEEIFASGTVFPCSFNDELLAFSFEKIMGNQFLESFFPGFRDCLVDYGVDVDLFLKKKIGESELARLKALVDRNQPSELKQENRLNYPVYIELLQRVKKEIYKKAKNKVDALDFDTAIQNISKSRQIGLECKRLRGLERETERKEAASRVSAGGGAAQESGGGAGTVSAGGASAGPAMDKKPG